LKIAVLSDVHGNLLALKACLNKIESLGVDKIFCLGDTAGYYPEFKNCFDLLEDYKVQHLMGNHEAMLVGLIPIDPILDEVFQLQDTSRSLSAELKTKVASLPHSYRFLDSNLISEMYHGSPEDHLNGRLWPDSFVKRYFTNTNFIFVGNTHRSFCRNTPWGKIVNVGSIGLPRDMGNLASFVVVDTVTCSTELVLTPLPIKKIEKAYAGVHEDVLRCLYRRQSRFKF